MMGIINHYLILIAVIGFYIVNNYKDIIIDNYINQSIDSESRATVLSVQSFVNNIFISILFVFIGYLTDMFSVDTVLISMGIITGVACLPFLAISNRVVRVRLKYISH